MDTSRRKLLTSAAALAALPMVGACKDDPAADPPPGGSDPTPERPAEPAAWDAPGAVDDEAFAWSVQAGDATPTAVLLSVRTSAPSLELVVMRGEGDDWVEVERLAVAVDDQVAQVELTDLQPDTVYRYAWYAESSRRSPVGRFRTAPDASAWRRLVIGATSCLGGSNPAWENLAHAAADDLDAFLLLGDTVYADPSQNLEQYRSYWKAALSKPSLAALCASTGLIATWDDHEVDNNWYLEGESPDPLGAEVSVERRDIALAAFREAIPMRVGGGELGMWRSLAWGEIAEFFVMDCRGERDGIRMMTEEQLSWVIEAVQASTAVFKIVLSSIHLADHRQMFGNLVEVDRWQGYPAQRGALVEGLSGVPGVLIITGDMHYGAIQRVAPPDEPGHELWEVAAGPSGSRLNPIPTLAVLPDQYPLVIDTWSWSRITLDPGTREAIVDFIGDEGTILESMTLAL